MRRAIDRAFTLACSAAILASSLLLVTILGVVAARGWRALDWSFLTEVMSGSGTSGGIAGHILGTLLLVGTAVAIAVPLAAGTGLLAVFYARPGRSRAMIEGVLQALNGVPSIVFGLVGLALIVRAGLGKSWLAGGVVLGVMILPTITIAFIEKLKLVPGATIEAAHGLGLRRHQIARAILIPQSAGGLASGTFLGLARAAGETAPIMFTAAIFFGPAVPRAIADSPVLALPYHVFVLAQDSLEPSASANMWGAALVLIVLVIGISAVALPARIRIREESRRG